MEAKSRQTDIKMTNQEKINEFILKHCENCANKNTEKCKITINRKG